MDNRDILDLAKLEFTLVQQQIDKYDDIGYKIKAWTVTLWVTLFGWAFQFNNPKVLLLSVVAVVVFYLLDAVNKNFRQDYKKRREQLATALQQYGRVGSWSADFLTPVMPSHSNSGVVRQALEPHIFLVYLPLVIVSLAAYVFRG